MKYFILYFLCLLHNISLSGQLSIQHSENIKSILVDSFSNVLFIDNNNNIFYLEGTTIKPYEIEYSRVLVKSASQKSNILTLDGADYLFKEGKLLKLSSSTLYKDGNFHLTFSNDELILKSFNKTCTTKVLEPVVDFIIDDYKQLILCKNRIIDICSNDIDTIDFNANAITAISANRFILSSHNNGLWILSHGKTKRFYVPGITFPKEYKNILYREGSLWMLTKNETLLRYDLNRQILQKVAVGVADFAFDKWNKLWYVTEKNIVTNTKYINNQPPELVINKIEVNNKAVPLRAVLEKLNVDETINVFYTINYSPSEKNKVEYRLNGKSWIETNASPLRLKLKEEGNYKIEIRGQFDNKYFSKIEKISIIVEKGFIGSWWFYTFFGLMGIIFLLLLAQLRISRKNKILDAEKKALKLELALVKKDQKLGQLQLNPHFIFNTMNSINGLIALDRKTDARKALSTFAKMMRTVLTFSFDEKIGIEDEIKFLKDYIDLERLIRDNKFDYQINCDLNNIKIPPMLIQPFVENAIIHGLQHKKARGLLAIDFEMSGRYYKVTVSDNGIGRDRAKLYKKESHTSSAVKIVKGRITRLDKWKTEPPIEYVDLIENGISTGTKCILNIPK